MRRVVPTNPWSTVPDDNTFALVLRPNFNDKEKERILLFSLLVKPDSLLHVRAYLGLGDKKHFAAEVAELKQRYGNLPGVLASATANEFSKQKKRVRKLCDRLAELRIFIAAHSGQEVSAATVLDELFPSTDADLAVIRSMLDRVCEEDDTPSALYAKFVDYLRTIPHAPQTIRVMTVMASKGLEADHIYVLGCNAGNIPGSNRSSHLTDHEHIEEQRRFLFVAFTRAKKSLTVSWSRNIPFHQSRGHYTASVGTTKIYGMLYSRVGISPFLQDLAGVTWEA